MTRARLAGFVFFGTVCFEASQGLAQHARQYPRPTDAPPADYAPPGDYEKEQPSILDYFRERPSGTQFYGVRVTFDERLFAKKAREKGLNDYQVQVLLTVRPERRIAALQALGLEPDVEKQITKLLDTKAHLPPGGPPSIPRGGGGGGGGSVSVGAPPAAPAVETVFAGTFVRAPAPDAGSRQPSAPESSQVLELRTKKLEKGRYRFLVKLSARLVSPVTQHSDCDKTQLHVTTVLGAGSPTKTDLAWMDGKTSVHEIPLAHEVTAAGEVIVRLESTMDLKAANGCPSQDARGPSENAQHSIDARLVVTQTERPKAEEPLQKSAPLAPAPSPARTPAPAPSATGSG